MSALDLRIFRGDLELPHVSRTCRWHAVRLNRVLRFFAERDAAPGPPRTGYGVFQGIFQLAGVELVVVHLAELAVLGERALTTPGGLHLPSPGKRRFHRQVRNARNPIDAPLLIDGPHLALLRIQTHFHLKSLAQSGLRKNPRHSASTMRHSATKSGSSSAPSRITNGAVGRLPPSSAERTCAAGSAGTPSSGRFIPRKKSKNPTVEFPPSDQP